MEYNIKIKLPEDFELLKLLIEKGKINPKSRDNYAIRYASGNGHLVLLKYLVSIGCDPKANDNHAIRWAASNGHLKVVKYLYKIGCDPKAIDWDIKQAARNGHLEVVKYFLELGRDHEEVKKSVKYEVLQDVKAKLLFFLNSRLGKGQNKYLKMEILKTQFENFSYSEIFSIL